MRPDAGPLNQPLRQPGLNAHEVLESARSGWDFLYVAGANPAMKYPGLLWSTARAKLGLLIVQDLFLTETAQQADVVLPTLAFVEKRGTFINIEGRLQPLLPGKEAPENILSDGEIFARIGTLLKISTSIDPYFAQFLTQTKATLQRPQKLEASLHQGKR